MAPLLLPIQYVNLKTDSLGYRLGCIPLVGTVRYLLHATPEAAAPRVQLQVEGDGGDMVVRGTTLPVHIHAALTSSGRKDAFIATCEGGRAAVPPLATDGQFRARSKTMIRGDAGNYNVNAKKKRADVEVVVTQLRRLHALVVNADKKAIRRLDRLHHEIVRRDIT